MPFTLDLDARCGCHFTYRDLVECGKTWTAATNAGAAIDNVPREAESVTALDALCRCVLDPLTDAFGRPELTYGFASPNLARHIEGRIAPRLDQHAAHERGRNGKLICVRGGAAVDLVVPGTSATAIGRWIFENTEFDRLYLYGDDRPVHVSFGPERSRAVIELAEGASGLRRPKILRW